MDFETFRQIFCQVNPQTKLKSEEYWQELLSMVIPNLVLDPKHDFKLVVKKAIELGTYLRETNVLINKNYDVILGTTWGIYLLVLAHLI